MRLNCSGQPWNLAISLCVAAMGFSMVVLLLVSALLRTIDAAPKKARRGVTHEDIVQLLNQQRDHEAWEQFREDFMASSLPSALVCQAVAIMDAAHQEGTLLGAPTHNNGSTASNSTAEHVKTNTAMASGEGPLIQGKCLRFLRDLPLFPQKTVQLPCRRLQMTITPCRFKLHIGTLSNAWHKASLQKPGKLCSPTRISWMEMFVAAGTYLMYLLDGVSW